MEPDLSGEISAALEVTDNGLKGAIKSRTANALDWLGGAALVSLFQRRAGKSAEQAAISQARVRIIETAGEIAVQKLKADNSLAADVIETHFGITARKEENVAAALSYTLDDLGNSDDRPANEDKGLDVPNDTLNRWRRYAEDADSDELRQRWGRVLSSEIRKPGTFSNQVMRTVDEISVEAAQVFDRISKFSFGSILIRSLVYEEMSFYSQRLLVEAGVLYDPGMGQIFPAIETSTQDGTPIRLFRFGDFGISLRSESKPIIALGRDSVFTDHNGTLGIKTFILTRAGEAIAGIVEQDRREVFKTLFDLVVKSTDGAPPVAYRANGSLMETFEP